MAAPTNVSFATATELGTLPASVTQQVDDAGVTFNVFFTFVAPDDAIVVGAWGWGGAADTGYQPLVRVYDHTQAQVSPSIVARNVPAQFPVVAGQRYYLKFTANGNFNPSTLTLNVQAHTEQSVSSGAIAIPDDTGGLPLAVLSATTNYDVRAFIAGFPAGEAGDVASTGVVLAEDQDAHDLKVFSNALVQTGALAFTGVPRIRACLGQDIFYVASAGNAPTVKTVTALGAFGGTTWSVTGRAVTGLAAIAAQNDGSMLYMAGTAAGPPIERYDLVGNAMTTNLVAGIANYQISDILVLADNSIVALYYRVSNGDVIGKRYDAAGATLNTYSIGTADLGNGPPRLAYSATSTRFWVWRRLSGSDAGKSQFDEITASTGVVATTRLHAVYEGGTYDGAQTATPWARFGSSASCPFFILRAGIGAPEPPPDEGGGDEGPPSVPATADASRWVMRRVRQSAHLTGEQVWMFYKAFALDVEAGVGLLSGTERDDNPQIMLQWSDDSGHTWSDERWMPLGRIGDFGRQVIWRQLGRARQRVFRITIDARVPIALLDAYLDITRGRR